MPVRSEDIREKIENGVYKLAVNDKSTRSTVWRVYRKIEKEDGTILENLLYCTGCKGLMSFTHKSTTNLRRHRCHLQYLKKQLLFGSKSSQKIHKNEIDTSKEEEQKQSANDETERIPAVSEMVVSKEEKQEQFEDEVEKKPTAADVAAFASACIVQQQLQPHPHLQNQPDMSMSLDVSEAQESSIYAQTWSLEYRKPSEDQKFYAKRAIDEIFVLGRLRRLTLNTVPPAE
ncbi:uncharacterized protein LOC117580472 [Drosophila guanche]|uniref:Blast:Transposable element Hobo transposase n=1 Tax=Drosophila guanche TaxID=7266 RepID=A0A3B0JWY9_DROGU|nr:uncharacterized protein LOC117580472 [Drosophila guanche]SPP77241.1 blast:Transposable element Hobo transposase [Drosophila guanche]